MGCRFRCRGRCGDGNRCGLQPEGRVGIHFCQQIGGEQVDCRGCGTEGRVRIHFGEEIGGDVGSAGRGEHGRAECRVGIHLGQEIGSDRVGAQHRGNCVGGGGFGDSGSFGKGSSLHRRLGQREIRVRKRRCFDSDRSRRGDDLDTGIVQQVFQIIVQLTVGGGVAHAACSIRIASSASTHSSARRYADRPRP